MQVCGFVVVFNNSLLPLFVFMHASLGFSACSCSCLSLYLQDTMMESKKDFSKLKSVVTFFFLRQCVFNAIGADIKYHKVRDMRTFACVDLCVWLGGVGGLEQTQASH